MRKALPRLLAIALIALLSVVAFHATLSAWFVKHYPSLSHLAITHLAEMGKRALPYVTELLESSEERVRRAGLDLLEAVGRDVDWAVYDPQLLRTVVAEFREETDPGMRRHITRVLASANAPAAVEALREGLKDPAIQGSCAKALERMAGAAPDPRVRRAAQSAAELVASTAVTQVVSAGVDLAGGAARTLLEIAPVRSLAGELFTTPGSGAPAEPSLPVEPSTLRPAQGSGPGANGGEADEKGGP